MLNSLSEMLRHTLKPGGEQVALKEEIAIVRSYLHIQKMRFGNRLEYELDIDKTLLEQMVPSMILQPFVENCVVHGIEPMVEVGHVSVSVSRSQDALQVTIRDDGVGMSKETLAGVLTPSGEANRTDDHSMGIRNVLRRLELHYNQTPVTIESTHGEGTMVQIALPLDNQEATETPEPYGDAQQRARNSWGE
jgi:two-component system sensor histidine kinase YesM